MEEGEQWEAARETLHHQWISDKNSVGRLLRLASECWLVLTDWDCCIKNEGLNYELFKTNLIDCCSYGLEHFADNESILCLFGYMMSLFPHLFCPSAEPNGGEYLAHESKGRSMLERAYRTYPDSLLAKVLFLGSSGGGEEYDKAKKTLKPLVASLFPGDTAVERYFSEILLGVGAIVGVADVTRGRYVLSRWRTAAVSSGSGCGGRSDGCGRGVRGGRTKPAA